MERASFQLGWMVVASFVLFLPVLATAQNTLGLSPREAEEARRTIVAWLECEECTEGELRSVLRLGGVAVPTLAAVSRGGPSPASRESYRVRLIRNYEKMANYAKSHPKDNALSLTREQYVDRYMSNYVALYKIRAGQALARIGGDEAKKALQTAIESAEREDVKDEIRKFLREAR